MLRLFLLTLLFISCKNEKINPEPIYSGTITFKEKSGLYGSIFAVKTTLHFKPDFFMREQELAGINKAFGIKAGIVIDLNVNQATLFFKDPLSKVHKKFITTPDSLLQLLKQNEIPYATPAPLDAHFRELDVYQLKKSVHDSTTLHGFSVDFAHFSDTLGVLEQRIFHTHQAVIDPKILNLVYFPKPPEIGLLLESKSNLQLSHKPIDSLFSNNSYQNIRGFIPIDTLKALDSAESTSGKVLRWALKLGQKGLEIYFERSLTFLEVSEFALDISALDLELSTFEALPSLDLFWNILPSPGSWDD